MSGLIKAKLLLSCQDMAFLLLASLKKQKMLFEVYLFIFVILGVPLAEQKQEVQWSRGHGPSGQNPGGGHCGELEKEVF